MIDTLIIRTLIDVVSVVVFMLLVVWTGRLEFILLEVRSFLNLVIRYLDVINYFNPYRDLMLTASSLIILIISPLFLTEYYKLVKTSMVIKKELKKSNYESTHLYGAGSQ